MHFRNGQRFFAWICVLLLATAGAVTAQDDSGGLYGTVTDTEGTALPGVSIELKGYGPNRLQVTDAQGQFRFLGLDPGDYELKASLEGFSTVEYPGVSVRLNRGTTLEIQLSTAIGEVITVTSEGPLLDEKKIQQGTTITQLELEKIPTARDPWSILNQTPGVLVDRINVGGNESGQQAAFTAPGQNDDENTFMVDGVEITDMSAVGSSATYYDFDQFSEMQFGTGGSDVTKASAGVSVNLVTKRGTNEFRGSARFLLTDANFFDVFNQSINVVEQPDSQLGDNQASFVGNSISRIEDLGFEAGGPVIRDRVWFWGSFGQNDINNRTGGATLASVQNDDTILENTAFRINAQLASNNSAVGSWNNGNKVKFGRNAGPTRPQPTTWDQRGPTAIIKFEDAHVASSNFFIGGSYGFVDGGFSLTSKAVVASSLETAPETHWDANGVWQNSYQSGSSSRPSEEWKLDGSYFFSTGNANHELKFGGRMREFEVESPFFWPGRNVFHVDGAVLGSPGDNFIFARRGFTPLTSQEYTSAWVQDTISAGNFTVNVGFRYDLQDGANEPFTADANQAFPNLLPALAFQGADAPFEWETILPRVGVTYALGEERKTLLRGSFSQFAEQLQTSNISRLNPLGTANGWYQFTDVSGDGLWQADEPLVDRNGDGVVNSSDLAGFNGFNPANPTSLSDPDLNDPNLDPAITNELIVGVEHAFLPEFVAGISFTQRTTDDLLSDGVGELLRELITDPATGVVRPATAADFVPDAVVTGTLPNGEAYSVQTFAIGCATAGCRTGGTFLENTDREVEYQGVSVNFIKRLSNQWMLRGFFNYGDADYSIGSSYRATADPNNLEGGFDDDGGLFAVQAAGSGAKQDVFVQSSWQWNVNGLYQVAPDRPWGFNVAANLYGREGTPLPYYHKIQGSDGITRDIQVTNEVDDFRTEDIFTTDLRLEKEFAATGNVGFTVSVDVFNVFDETYVLQRRRQTNTGQFDNLTETLSPRIWRLGVRLNWR